MVNSKLLFQQLLGRLTMDGDRGEKEAVLYLVLRHKYNLSRTDVMRAKEIPADRSVLDEVILRLNNNEPVQYVLGSANFHGRDFYVNSSVLIPRPETEFLVDLAVAHAKTRKEDISILDIGTGSGCIAISVALQFPQAKIIATDISEAALSVARKNAELHNAKIFFHQHDILTSPLSFGRVDVVVSNPPYIKDSERLTMHENVIGHEPPKALFVPDGDPLLFYKAITCKAKESLTSKGILITEISEHYGKETAEVFKHYGYHDIKVIKDLDGKNRFVSGQVE